MAKVRVVLDRRGVRALLRSDGVTDDLKKRAERIAAAAGAGFEADVDVGRNRSRASVRTTDFRSRHAEARDRRLTKSIDAGR